MDIPANLLTAFPPSNQLLLDVARRQVDDDMLEEIGDADYGVNADRHLEALRPIRDTGVVPPSLGWYPGEVLELIRWSDPENPAHKPGSPGRRGHQIRAFACAVLLRTGAEGGDNSTEEATLAQCLASAKVLGEEFNDAAARFFTWRLSLIKRTASSPEPDDWLFDLGLLVVATRFGKERITDCIFGDATDLVLAEEGEFRRAAGFNPADTRAAAFGLTYGFWKPLLAELSASAARVESADVRNNLEMIGRILLDESP